MNEKQVIIRERLVPAMYPVHFSLFNCHVILKCFFLVISFSSSEIMPDTVLKINWNCLLPSLLNQQFKMAILAVIWHYVTCENDTVPLNSL